MRSTLAAVLMSCVLALVGCEKKASAPPSSPSGGTAAAPSGGSPGVTDDTILLGEVGSLTGSEATFGISTRNAIDLAIREVNAAGKMVATICHGPWVLISAGIVRGRRLTSTIGIRDDVVNAGAEWVDAPSMIDGNIVSSRVPKDLPAFGRAMLEVLAKQR